MNVLRFLGVACVCVVSLLLTACGGAGPQRDVLVSVRDAETLKPIPSVVVRVETLNPTHPFNVVKQLFGGGEYEPGPDGLTNGDGQVRLWTYSEVPMNILVGAPGYGVETFFFADHPLDVAPNLWAAPTSREELPGDDDSQRRRFQVMFSDPAKAPA